MQNCSTCNVIIPQFNPKTQEAVDKLLAKMQGIQDSEPMKQLKAWSEQYNNKLQEITGYSAMVKQAKTASEAWNGVQVNSVAQALNEKLGCVFSPEIQNSIDLINRKAELFNEQIKVMLEAAVVVVEKTVVNIYKKIVSSVRAIRSHKKAASRLSVVQDDGGGGSSDPDPACQPHYLPLTPTEYFLAQSKFFLWRTNPGSCRMAGGGQI